MRFTVTSFSDAAIMGDMLQAGNDRRLILFTTDCDYCDNGLHFNVTA